MISVGYRISLFRFFLKMFIVFRSRTPSSRVDNNRSILYRLIPGGAGSNTEIYFDAFSSKWILMENLFFYLILVSVPLCDIQQPADWNGLTMKWYDDEWQPCFSAPWSGELTPLSCPDLNWVPVNFGVHPAWIRIFCWKVEGVYLWRSGFADPSAASNFGQWAAFLWSDLRPSVSVDCRNEN